MPFKFSRQDHICESVFVYLYLEYFAVGHFSGIRTCHLCCPVRITLGAIKPLLYSDGWRKRPTPSTEKPPLSPIIITAAFQHSDIKSTLTSFYHDIYQLLGALCVFLAIISMAVGKESEYVLKIFVFYASRSELEISELSRRIFSITVISESWWILTRLPQWITMQWQKFYTTASPHHHHDRKIQPMISKYSNFLLFWMYLYLSVKCMLRLMYVKCM